MPYEVPYRSARIIFADRDEYREKEEEFLNTKRAMDGLLDNLKTRLEDGIFKDNKAFFFRVAPSDAITTYIGLSHNHNPYVFSYDARTKQVSRNIPYDFFRKIGIAPYTYIFEDVIKDKYMAAQEAFFTEDIKKQLETLSKEYDDEIGL